MAPSPLLKLADVTKRYDSPDNPAPLTVLSGVSLEAAGGESLAIVGPSGSGKSTLLHIIGTLDRPTSGAVFLEDQDLSALDEAQLAAVRNQQIGFVFQAHYLLPQCSVLENVLVPTLASSQRRKPRGQRSEIRDQTSETSDGPPNTDHATRNPDGRSLLASAATTMSEPPEKRATRLLGRVGLADRLAHRPGQLSGGERQRVAVVRALINRPKLLLADEPTGSLDHVSALKLTRLLLELNREEGVTLIVVTHALDLARQMGRVLELKEGRLV